MDTNAADNSAVDHWSHHRSILWILAAVILAAHLFACLWFLVMDLSGGDAVARLLGPQQEPLCGSAYSLALLEGAGLLCGVSLPVARTEVERIVLAMAIVASTMAIAVLFARLVVLVHRITIMSNNNHEHMAFIQSACKQLGLESGLRSQILRYHAFTQRHHNPDMYEALLGSLSPQLLRSVKLELFRNFIEQCPLLHKLDGGRILDLISAFEEFVYSPGDVVMRVDEAGASMFFIVKGSCEVLGRDGEQLAILHKGHYFGEVCLLFPELRRTATIRTTTFCVLACLSIDKFASIIPEGSKEHTEIRKRIESFQNVQALLQTPSEGRLEDSPLTIGSVPTSNTSEQRRSVSAPAGVPGLGSKTHSPSRSLSPSRSPLRGRFFPEDLIEGVPSQPRASLKTSWSDTPWNLRSGHSPGHSLSRRSRMARNDGSPSGYSGSSPVALATPRNSGDGPDLAKQLQVLDVNMAQVMQAMTGMQADISHLRSCMHKLLQQGSGASPTGTSPEPKVDRHQGYFLTLMEDALQAVPDALDTEGDSLQTPMLAKSAQGESGTVEL